MRAYDKNVLTENALQEHLEKWISKSGNLPPVAVGAMTRTRAGNIGLEVKVPTIAKYTKNSKELGKPHPLNPNTKIKVGHPVTLTTVIVVPLDKADFVLSHTDDHMYNRGKLVIKLSEQQVHMPQSALYHKQPANLTRLQVNNELTKLRTKNRKKPKTKRSKSNTKQQVYDTLNSLSNNQGTVKVSDIAKALGKTTTNVRHHLKKLVKEGKINVKMVDNVAVYTTNSLDELPETPDLVILVIPARLIPEFLEDMGRQNIDREIIVTGGYKEIGECN